MSEVILIKPPGGMRNVIVDGIQDGLGLKPENVDEIHATSSNVGSTIGWLAGLRGDELLEAWLKLARLGVFNTKHWPPANIDLLIRFIDEHFDIAKACNTKQRLIVSTYHPGSGKTHYTEVTENNIWNLLLATVAIPWVTRRVFINGERHADGGMLNPLPVDQLKDRVHGTKFIFLLHRPLEYEIQNFWFPLSMGIFPKHPKSWFHLAKRGTIHKKSVCYIQNELEKCSYVIAPDRDIMVNRFENSEAQIIAGYRQGRIIGETHREVFWHFLKK